MEFIKIKQTAYLCMGMVLMNVGCGGSESSQEQSDKVQLMVIEPQHFHAALVQKYKHDEIDAEAYLYAESDAKVVGYNQLIEQYNSREADPTSWKITAYYGIDFLDKAFQGDAGNVVVLAGDNHQKIDFIAKSVENGRDVFADKPLVIDSEGYSKLEALLREDNENSALVYDIMTERYDVKNQVIKALVNDVGFSGGLQQESAGPAIQFQSTHHFIKDVSGTPLVRPAMFFNTKQQGEGLVDVTTHYIDLVQWMLSNEQVIDIERDIQLHDAKRWGTKLSKQDFERATSLSEYPSSLLEDVDTDQRLNVFSNGKLDYSFKGVPVSIAVEWAVESLDGRGDQFYASFLADQFKIEVKPDDSGKMAVFLTPNNSDEEFAGKLENALASYTDLPGLGFEASVDGQYKILIPDELYLGHEDHFAKVLQQFLVYRKEKSLPAWERSFLLAKYYLTTKALETAKQ